MIYSTWDGTFDLLPAKPLQPPITIRMLKVIQDNLCFTEPFDICVWAAATSCFYGLMRLGEAACKSRRTYSPETHISRGSAFIQKDAQGHRYAELFIPAAKTAQPGELQRIFLANHQRFSPVAALVFMCAISQAQPTDPLFSRLDQKG